MWNIRPIWIFMVAPWTFMQWRCKIVFSHFNNMSLFFAVSQCWRWEDANDVLSPALLCTKARQKVSFQLLSTIISWINLFSRSECPLEKNNYIDHRWVFIQPNFSFFSPPHNFGFWVFIQPNFSHFYPPHNYGFGVFIQPNFSSFSPPHKLGNSPTDCVFPKFTRHIFFSPPSQYQ